MRRKLLCLTLILLLCVSLAVPALAIGTNATTVYGARTLLEIWKISDVTATGHIESVTYDGNGGFTRTVIKDTDTKNPGNVYYTKSPATAVLELSRFRPDGLKDSIAAKSEVTIRKVKYENGAIIAPGGYKDIKPIEPDDGKLTSYVDHGDFEGQTFWEYSTGAKLTLGTGAYIFDINEYNHDDDYIFLIVGDGSDNSLVGTPNASSVLVNGKDVAFDAYTINENNYFKLRDLAFVLSGTKKQFEVGWDGTNNAISLTSGKKYTSDGSELKGKAEGKQTPALNTSKIYLDGKEVKLTAYTIGGFNYFKLRDLGEAIDFDVTWDGAKNTIVIDSSASYNPAT
ncbi:MAG: hypothetical protein LBN97_04495 [Oscillospiraceae bacterium]|jgi:hypothetical protein|nr:hypothetical protein [Oscillospiraceae bacterium]